MAAKGRRDATMPLPTRTGGGSCPKVYCADGFSDCWIAEGTDGYLYKVPKEPGGWLVCQTIDYARYDKPAEDLRPVSAEEARSIMWFVYGDVGNIKIATE